MVIHVLVVCGVLRESTVLPGTRPRPRLRPPTVALVLVCGGILLIVMMVLVGGRWAFRLIDLGRGGTATSDKTLTRGLRLSVRECLLVYGCLVMVSVCIIAWVVIGCCISGVVFVDHSIRSLFQTRVGGCRVTLANAAHEAVGDGVGGSHAVGRLEAAWFVGDHGDGVLFGDLAEDFVLVTAPE